MFSPKFGDWGMASVLICFAVCFFDMAKKFEKLETAVRCMESNVCGSQAMQNTMQAKQTMASPRPLPSRNVSFPIASEAVNSESK